MTKSLSKKNVKFIVIFTSIEVLLASSALAIAIMPKFVVNNTYTKSAFCIMLCLIGIATILMKLLFNAGITNVLRHYYIKKTQCVDSDCLMNHKAKSRHIYGSIFQGLIAIAFATTSISLAYLIFFNKIPQEKILLFTKIYCFAFAGSILGSCIISFLVNFIVDKYCKSKLTRKNDKEENEFKDSIKNKTNTVINFANFFHSIANILLSPHFYACHLFVTRDHFTANYIAYDDGIRGGKLTKGAEITTGDEKKNILAILDIIGKSCKELSFVGKQEYECVHITNTSAFIVSGNGDDRKVFAAEKKETFEEAKVGIKFNMFGVEVSKLSLM